MNAKEMILWAVGMVLFATVLCSPVACTMRRHQLVADAIAGGADPIAAKCAIESGDMDSRTSSLCLVKALEKSR